MKKIIKKKQYHIFEFLLLLQLTLIVNNVSMCTVKKSCAIQPIRNYLREKHQKKLVSSTSYPYFLLDNNLCQ